MYPVPKLYQLKYEKLCVYYLCWKLHAVLTMFYLTENCCTYLQFLQLLSSSFILYFEFHSGKQSLHSCVSHPS